MPGAGGRFRHHRDNRLPFDVVVVDETSMVSLTMMARLLEAVRPDARLVLVGDPDQLASVEAGAVLADLVAGLTGRRGAAMPADRPATAGAPCWTDSCAASRGGDRRPRRARSGTATPTRRSRCSSGVRQEVAGRRRRRRGRARTSVDAALARCAPPHWPATPSPRWPGWSGTGCCARTAPARAACRSGAGRSRRWLAERARRAGTRASGTSGRPVLVTTNDYAIGLFNGDTGVVDPGLARQLRVVVHPGAASCVRCAPRRLAEVQTVHAMTVHRSQGSQFDRVTFVLPPEDSPLLTRELLYTALTRAREFVRLVGTPEQLRAAIERRAARASGLGDRLRRS